MGEEREVCGWLVKGWGGGIGWEWIMGGSGVVHGLSDERIRAT